MKTSNAKTILTSFCVIASAMASFEVQAEEKKRLKAIYEVPTDFPHLKGVAINPMGDSYMVEKPDGDEITYTLPRELTGEKVTATFKQNLSVKGLKYFEGPGGAVSCADEWDEMKCIIKCADDFVIDQNKVQSYLKEHYTGQELTDRIDLAAKFGVEPIGIIRGLKKAPSGNAPDSAVALDFGKPRTGEFAVGTENTSQWFRIEVEGLVDIKVSFKGVGGGEVRDQADLDLAIYDSQQTLIKESTGFGSKEDSIRRLKLDRGVYYIELKNPMYTGATEFSLVVQPK